MGPGVFYLVLWTLVPWALYLEVSGPIIWPIALGFVAVSGAYRGVVLLFRHSSGRLALSIRSTQPRMCGSPLSIPGQRPAKWARANWATTPGNNKE